MTKHTHRSTPAFATASPHDPARNIITTKIDIAVPELTKTFLDFATRQQQTAHATTAPEGPPSNLYTGTFLAPAKEACGNERARRILAVRCALLHALKSNAMEDTYMDLADQYMLAGPEFCVAILGQEEHAMREIPF